MSSIFLSYSHRDEALRDRLEVHLATLKRDGTIAVWHDRRILAGDDFAGQIDEHLEQADIILLLVSPDFLASDYCHDVEMRRALERHAEGSARVIPVILEPCDWQHAPFGSLLAVPTDGKPITTWANQNEAFVDVIQHLRDALPASAQTKRAGTHPIPIPAPVDAASPGPRSSNLRLRKRFSDADRDRFIDDAFEFMARFFRNSLDELAARNPRIEHRFRRIDASCFTAVVYEDGKALAECAVCLGSVFGRGISYSNDAGGARNSYNETLAVEHDDQHLFLRATLSGVMMGGERDAQLSPEGAAEYYWSMLIEPLQRDV